MPFLQIFTTISRTKIPENFGPLLAREASNGLRGKTVEKITVQITPEQYLSIGEQENVPFALVYLQSIGSMDVEDNRQTVKIITDIIHSKLGIEPNHIRMVFQNLSPDTVGVQGKLAMDLMQAK